MVQFIETGLEERADEVRARYVEVGEVGAVGFVQVVIAFPKRGVGGCYYGEEERRGARRGGY